MLNKLSPREGSTRKCKRVGRGPGRRGKTSGRGHKGQRSRSGGRVSTWFEGGQTPLKLRSIKRGFKNPNRIEYEVVNIKSLNTINKVDRITPDELKKARLVTGKNPIKILGHGELDRKISIIANHFTKTAIEKIEEKGGKAEII
jgi:large subunit ribosomal protein L15